MMPELDPRNLGYHPFWDEPDEVFAIILPIKESMMNCGEEEAILKIRSLTSTYPPSIVNVLHRFKSTEFSDAFQCQYGQKITILVYAMLHCKTKIAAYLLEQFSADLELEFDLFISQRLVKGVTALWLAVYLQSEEMVHLLIQSGADINHGTLESTPLRVACYDNSVDIARILVANGADVDKANSFRNTPLMISAYQGHEQLVKILLDAGADVNAQALCGETPLHFAAQTGHVDIVRLLIESKAKFILDNNGLTPLMEAARCGQQVVTTFLLSIPTLATLANRITVSELLATSKIFTQSDYEDFNFEFVFHHLVDAMWYRCCGLPEDSLDYPPNQPPGEDFPEKPLLIPKRPTGEPVVPNHNLKECQSISELSLIRDDPDRLIIECLLILERILGGKCLLLAENLIEIGAILIDQHRDKVGYLLWIHAITIKINARYMISEDLNRFVRALYLNYRKTPVRAHFIHHSCDCIEDLFRIAIKFYQLQPAIYGHYELALRLSFDSESFDVEQFSSKATGSKMKYFYNTHPRTTLNETDSAFTGMFYLCGLLSEILDSWPVEKCTTMFGTLEQFCRLNVASKRSGATMMHLCFSSRFTSLTKNYFFLRKPYPSFKVAKMLIRFGASVDVFDKMYNTPLHYFSCFDLRNEILTSSGTIDELIEMYRLISKTANTDCHCDAVNIINETFSSIPLNPVIKALISDCRVLPLKCLAGKLLHRMYMRCDHCRRFPGPAVPDELDESGQEPMLFFYDSPGCHLPHYGKHISKGYDWKRVCRMIRHFRDRLSICTDLVLFIEMHGSCKLAFMAYPVDP